jgi:hypothetical protein
MIYYSYSKYNSSSLEKNLKNLYIKLFTLKQKKSLVSSLNFSSEKKITKHIKKLISVQTKIKK